MLMAGALVALLPSTLRACGHGEMGEGTAYVHVPILNNTGEDLTIRSMFIDTPDVTGVCKKFKSGKLCSECKGSGQEDEMRVKAISFGGVSYYTASSTGHSHCRRHNSEQDIEDKTINHDDYTFSGAKVECKIAFDVCPADLPSGTYTIRYYFKYDDDAEEAADRTNMVTFNLP